MPGVCWPLVSGRVSTTVTTKECLAHSLWNVDPDAADKVLGEKRWRDNYVAHFINHVKASATSSETALTIASNGLNYVYSHFGFERDGVVGGLMEAMRCPLPNFFTTVEIQGELGSAKQEFQVPYHGKLGGSAFRVQLDQWVADGIIEPSAADAAWSTASASFKEQRSSHAFVVFGAGAAMGPARTLLELGFTVVAIDLDRSAIWQSLVQFARKSCGTLIVPVRSDAASKVFSSDVELCACAGCNLLTAAPEVADWLMKVCPGRTLTVGQYAYMDGEGFVRIAVAQDAVAAMVVQQRGKDQVSLAYLCTPTDVHLRPIEARQASEKAWERRPAWMKAAFATSQGNVCKPNIFIPSTICNAEGVELDIVECTVSTQGPNYLFAKRLQHWRSMLARQTGVLVSSNIAPSTYTESVTKARILKAAYDGVSNFAGIEIFPAETSNVVMAATLLYDIFDASSCANPKVQLSHPLMLFSFGAWHGGMWRFPVSINSCVVLAALIGLAQEFRTPLLAGSASVAVAGRFLATHWSRGRAKL